MSFSRVDRGPLIAGFGLGGLLDGVVLHQILQWHHLVSSRMPANGRAELARHTAIDGWFHLLVIAVAVAGVWMWLRRGRFDVASLGGLLIGWGTFNIADHVVFHLALEAHHIRMAPNPALYDWAFFALGVALVGTGWALRRRFRRSPT